MSADQFIESESEVKGVDFLLDVRPWGTRVIDALARPEHHGKLMICLGIASVVLAPIWMPITAAMALIHLLYQATPKYAPLRYAKDLGGLDPSNIVDPNDPKWQKANGVWYLGTERSRFPWKAGREVWLGDGDLGMHGICMGTTGSGKTQALLSWNFNALCWGSGFSYTDGKADNELVIKIWTMLRRFGREDSFLLINYLTGGADPFTNTGPSRKRRSNKANMFSDAPMDFLSELLTSMLPKAEGDAATWQAKAINMMKAVVRVCCFLRAERKIEVSVQTLREYMQLQKLEELYVKGEKRLIPEIAFSAIRSYLLTGISWNPQKFKEGKPQTNEVLTQHGYLTNQFLAPLSMLADTYGHIFADPFPEVDMADVMLRRRALVTAIPTLEKSAQEAANLGKLVIGAMKLMMGKNLGNEVEGSYQSTIRNKATNARSRFPITLDELGYYFAPGLDLVFAQARSLKFAMIAAGQDFAAMKKEGGDEVISMIGNTKLKVALAIEDPTETFEIFEKAAGEAKIAQSSGSEITPGSGSWNKLLTSSLQDTARVTFRELKRLISGQGVAIFMDRVTRFNAFYIFSDKDRKGFLCPHVLDKYNIKFKINRYLQIYKSSYADIADKCRPLAGAKKSGANQVYMFLLTNTQPVYEVPQDNMVEALKQAAERIPASVGAVERGIALFMAASDAIALESKDASGTAGQAGEEGAGGVAERPRDDTQSIPASKSGASGSVPVTAGASIADEDIDPLALLLGEDAPVVEVERAARVSSPAAPTKVQPSPSIAPELSVVETSQVDADTDWFVQSIQRVAAGEGVAEMSGHVAESTPEESQNTIPVIAEAANASAEIDVVPGVPDDLPALPDLPIKKDAAEAIGIPYADSPTTSEVEIVFEMIPSVKEAVLAIETLTGAVDCKKTTHEIERQVSDAVSTLIGKENVSNDDIEDVFAEFDRALKEGAK